MNEISLSLSYKVQGGDIFDDLKKDINENYIINIQSKPGTAAMGNWDSVVEVILNVELKDYVMIVLGGVAWDLVKMGSRRFFLRPLVQAFEKLEKQHEHFDYTSLRLKFQDTEIVIYGLKKLFSSRLGTTMPLIAMHYNNIVKLDLTPHTIYVPIRFDSERQVYIDYGEADNFELNEYKKLWGVFYDAFGYDRDVYDVAQKKLLTKEFI